jgi:hypothetical protein
LLLRFQNVSGHVSGSFKTELGAPDDSTSHRQRTQVHTQESPMNTSFTARATALIAAVLVTFGAVKAIADYAYPAPAAVQLASASH